jgi:hypothetical protein
VSHTNNRPRTGEAHGWPMKRVWID